MLKLVWNFYKDTLMEKSDLQTRLEEARARRKAQIAQYTKKEAEKEKIDEQDVITWSIMGIIIFIGIIITAIYGG